MPSALAIRRPATANFDHTPFRDLRIARPHAPWARYSIRGTAVRPDHKEFIDGLKLVAIAITTAVLTATVVIGAGRVVFDQSPRESGASTTGMIRTASR